MHVVRDSSWWPCNNILLLMDSRKARLGGTHPMYTVYYRYVYFGTRCGAKTTLAGVMKFLDRTTTSSFLVPIRRQFDHGPPLAKLMHLLCIVQHRVTTRYTGLGVHLSSVGEIVSTAMAVTSSHQVLPDLAFLPSNTVASSLVISSVLFSSFVTTVL